MQHSLNSEKKIENNYVIYIFSEFLKDFKISLVVGKGMYLSVGGYSQCPGLCLSDSSCDVTLCRPKGQPPALLT